MPPAEYDPMTNDIAAVDAGVSRLDCGLTELIERLEKASGEDEELDVEIWVATGGNQGHALNGVWNGKKCWWETTRYDRCEKRETTRMRAHVSPPFTSSIDAALTLLSDDVPGWELNFAYNGYPYMATVIDIAARDHTGFGKTPAIALCIAALRARLSQSTPTPNADHSTRL